MGRFRLAHELGEGNTLRSTTENPQDGKGVEGDARGALPSRWVEPGGASAPTADRPPDRTPSPPA